MIERAYSAIRAAEEGGVLTLTLWNPARKNAIGPVMVLVNVVGRLPSTTFGALAVLMW